MSPQALLRARQYAEEIVLYRGAGAEFAHADRVFTAILGIRGRRVGWDVAAGAYRGVVDWVAERISVPNTRLTASLYKYVGGVLWGGFEHPYP